MFYKIVINTKYEVCLEILFNIGLVRAEEVEYRFAGKKLFAALLVENETQW